MSYVEHVQSTVLLIPHVFKTRIDMSKHWIQENRVRDAYNYPSQ